MPEPTDAVAAHYGFGGLRARIERALEGRTSDSELSEEDVSGAAEFHIGGRAASMRVISKLELDGAVGARALDLGSGLGGTARLIASTTSASVEGVDLTPEFVDVATWLSNLTGYADRTNFQVGSVAEPLPWVEHFDAATMLHVGMNIEDKAGMAATVHRALRPGARFAIYDVMAGPAGAADLTFPVPWATSAATSHVAPATEYVAALSNAGFDIVEIEDLSEWASAALTSAPPPSSINLGLVMGPETPTKVTNMRTNLTEGRIAPTLIVAHRR